MPKINILNDITINKIAAGEVIERPASIIKELVENSIDAGATQISVEISSGGKNLIKIIDNGCGIDKDDVNKAFLRHATSKITQAEDLYALSSLGFRGEALASISACSKMEMITKTEESIIGTRIVLHGGVVSVKEAVAANTGTQIIVRDLFYNIPARRKFLKSNQSETMAITDLMNKLAIGNPHIRFKYINNKKIAFETPGDGELYSTIRMLYGKDIADNLIHIDYKTNFYKISGYTANNNVYRSNRNMQHIFINGRYVKSTNIMNVLNESYKAIIPINKFPIYFINLEMDPATIDVNIHPNKLEVKFNKEAEVLSSLSDYIRGVLLKSSLIGRYREKFTPKKEEIIESKEVLQKNEEVREFDAFSTFTYSKPSEVTEAKEEKPISLGSFKSLEEIEEVKEVKEEVKDTPIINTPSIHEKPKQISFIEEEETAKNSDFKNLKYIGIVFDTYILFQKNEDMVMMDQHAAHERVRFEMYMKQFKSNTISTQMLLDPFLMDLSPTDMMVVSKNLDVFERYGFAIELFGHKNISISGVPNTFGNPESKRFIYEIIDNLHKMDNIYDAKYDDIAEIACKSAIKANDKITDKEALALLRQLEACENPYTCPHGRPVLVKMSKYDIEKMFKRKM